MKNEGHLAKNRPVKREILRQISKDLKKIKTESTKD